MDSAHLTKWCCYLTENPIGVIPGNNMLYHKPHVRMECMFGFDPASGCTDCIANKFWVGSYKKASDHSGPWWGDTDFQLTFTGHRCTEFQGLYRFYTIIFMLLYNGIKDVAFFTLANPQDIHRSSFLICQWLFSRYWFSSN